MGQYTALKNLLIPIKNIYYLLCYAWDFLSALGTIDVDTIDSNKPIDLFAHVLVNGMHHLMRRGIEQGYQEREQVLSALRGKVNFIQSIRHLHFQRATAVCAFDELSVNTLSNRILKASFFRLSQTSDLDDGLRQKCTKLWRQFHQVEDIHLTRQLFHRVQFHGNNRFYRFLINICELIFIGCLPDEKAGAYHFQNFLREKMPRLFEKFILNFYIKEQSEFNVTSEKIHWQAYSTEGSDLSYLPSMLTDVSLRSGERTIIIDAKYYSETLSQYYDKLSIHSKNLYQIYAYLKNLERAGGNDSVASGILLYPVVNRQLSLGYEIDGHHIRIETLDLAADWKDIENRLLGLLQHIPHRQSVVSL